MPRSRTKQKSAPSEQGEEKGEITFYLNEAKRHKVMTRDEERVLAYQIRAGGAEGLWARNEFVKRNMRLVVTIARKYTCEDMPLPDLLQEGNIGLMRALEKFDPDRGFKFSTYASWWVRQSMVRSIHNAGAIRLPSFIVTARYQLSQVEGRADHPLTDEERKEKTGFSDALLHKLRVLPVAVTTLDNPVYEEGDTLMVDTVADPSVGSLSVSEREIDLAQFREQVESALHDVPERDREILFAWASGENISLEELGRGVGVTRERVRQILLHMFAKLRLRLRL